MKIPKTSANIVSAKLKGENKKIIYVGFYNEDDGFNELYNRKNMKFHPWHIDYSSRVSEKADMVLFSEGYRRRFINSYLQTLKEDELIYARLKKDGQFHRYFDNLFTNLFYRLRGKVNQDFKGGKIPNDELEFLKSLNGVIAHRIAIIEDDKTK